MQEIKLKNSYDSITREEVHQFIDEFNLKLPESYISFILKHNGGYPDLSAFGDPYEDGSDINCFYSISLTDYIFDIDSNIILPSREIIQTHQIDEQNLLKYLYPFADDAGGAEYCLSMREEDFGVVYIFFMDGTSDEPVYLCSSFEELINGLEDSDNYLED